MTKRRVLLIIDMQKGSFTKKTPRFDTDGVVARINRIANTFRASKDAVIYIQHDGTEYGEFLKNTEEWELLDELQIDVTDRVIDKYANDAFYKSKLHSTLQNLGVDQIFITGCATDFCVESTIQAALTRDYYITVVADAHTTGERPNLTAKQVIEHYNWVWQNMIPTRGKIEVKNCEEIITTSQH
jgi:nicotinamidase-related amidase